MSIKSLKILPVRNKFALTTSDQQKHLSIISYWKTTDLQSWSVRMCWKMFVRLGCRRNAYLRW